MLGRGCASRSTPATAITNTFAAMTGMAFIITPYITHINAPTICTRFNVSARVQKYDPTNTAVAAQPR